VKRFLVDPVLNGPASPLPSTTRSFPGSDIYTKDDIPEIEYLILTHDHWDHLDYVTLQKLKPKIRTIITSLGVASHKKHQGFTEDIMMPEEAVQPDIDLKGKMILPFHWGKFSLSLHEWNKAIKRVVVEGEKRKVHVLHPMTGEKISLTSLQVFTRWWDF
jgi:L-ascorbate metabolism protein UlaG (beta-lactamase superfamily)